MFRHIAFFLLLTGVLVSCKDQTPEVTQNPPPPPVPSPHIIDNEFYVQFTYGKAGDTMTYEELDDSTLWADSNFVNVVLDIRSEEIFDTTGASENQLEPPYPKIGWHYAPTTMMISKTLYDYQNAEPGEEPAPEDLLDASVDIFSISFPWSTDDTLAVWDVEDYLNHPEVKEGQIRWGRIGNNTFGDTVWNNDARDGVVISFIDTAGMEWRSDFKPTFQPYGYFVVSSQTPNLEDGKSYDIIDGEFAVRLYNKFQQWKDVRYGKFRMRLYDDIEYSPEPK